MMCDYTAGNEPEVIKATWNLPVPASQQKDINEDQTANAEEGPAAAAEDESQADTSRRASQFQHNSSCLSHSRCLHQAHLLPHGGAHASLWPTARSPSSLISGVKHDICRYERRMDWAWG